MIMVGGSGADSDESLCRPPTLPVEICEHIIDHLVDESSPTEDKVSRDLRACRLVCRAWVPRCRFHLFRSLNIVSQDMLQSIASFFQTSPFHADRVQTLRFRGGGSDDSWIAIAPICLPQLRNLRHVEFFAVEFSQQHPRLPQFYSHLRSRSLGPSHLSVDQDQVLAAPATITALAAVLYVSRLCFHTTTLGYAAETAHDLAQVATFPQKLKNLITLAMKGSPKHLLEILRAWSFTAPHWRLTVQSTITDSEGLREQLPEMQKLWRTIYRIHGLSIARNLSSFIVAEMNGMALYLDSQCKP